MQSFHSAASKFKSVARKESISSYISSCFESSSTTELQSVYLAVWFVSSIALGFSTKLIVAQLNAEYSLSLMAFQALSTTIAVRIIGLVSYFIGKPQSNITWSLYWSSIVPSGVFFAISIATSTAAYTSLPLMTLQLFVPFTAPLLTELGRIVFCIDRGVNNKWWTIVFISLSLAVTSAGGSRFGAFGTELLTDQEYRIIHLVLMKSSVTTILSVIGIIAQTIATVSLEKSIKNLETQKIGPAEVLHHYMPIIAAALVIVSFHSEPNSVDRLFHLQPSILFCNGLLGTFVFISVPYIIQATGSTSLALIEGIKISFLTIFSSATNSIGINHLEVFGFFLALLGFSSYLQRKEGVKSIQLLDQESYPIFRRDSLVGEIDDELQISLQYTNRAKSTSSLANVFVFVTFILTLSIITFENKGINSSQTVSLNNIPDHQILLNRTKVATIIETRNLPHLAPLIVHFLAVLPTEWPVVVWCSPINMPVLQVTPSLSRHIESGRLNLTLLPDTIDIHDRTYLSRFLTSPWFWQQFGLAEWMLFFQSDSIICSRSQQSIEDWVGFDWVGAPWNDKFPNFGGNGGLSMRKISSMLKVIRNTPRQNDDMAEDVYFSEALAKLPETVWPDKHQGNFSVEEQYGSMRDWAWKPFGLHSGGKDNTSGMWQDRVRMSRLMEWCPEVNIFYNTISQISMFTNPTRN